MTTDAVLAEIDRRGVATVTLNRPDVNNAYNGEMILGLIEAFGALAADAQARIVVIRGNGRHFQAGADLKWIKETSKLSPEANLKASANTTNALRGLNEFPKPTVALVHGGCFGGGIGLVASCDIVIASEDAIFAITEVRWGLIAAPMIPQLNARIGLASVRRYALTAERFDARQAKEIGLVNEVSAVGKLDEAAVPIIDALLMCGPDAIAQTKACALELDRAVLDDDLVARLAHARGQAHNAGRRGGTRKLPREAQARLVPGRSPRYQEIASPLGELLLYFERARRAGGDGRAHPRFVGGRRIDYEFAAFNLEDLRQRLHAIARVNTDLAIPDYFEGHDGLSSCFPLRGDHARSKRSRSITLAHAATKSFTNLSFESRAGRSGRSQPATNPASPSSRHEGP
jgi:methylglutaconyl-CoA hydratase